jgi:hypothetical protein
MISIVTDAFAPARSDARAGLRRIGVMQRRTTRSDRRFVNKDQSRPGSAAELSCGGI